MQRSTRSAALAAMLALAPILTLLTGGRPAEAQVPSPYVMQKISLPGSQLNYGEGINNSGVAVGGADPSGLLRDFALNAAIFSNGQVSGAGVLVGYQGSYDYAINDNGDSAGWALKLLGIYPGGGELYHAVLFAHGTAQDLGALPGNGNNSLAYAINHWRVAAGSSQGGALSGSTHAVLFTFANHTVTDLGTVPGDGSSVAYGINDYGLVVGSSIDGNGVERAAQFAPGPVKLLGALPGDNYSEARGVNDQGQAVGYSASLRGPMHAVMFTGGQVVDLGVAPGGTDSFAHAINNFGQAVGYGNMADGTTHALLFQNGQVVDLGKFPAGSGSSANGVNDRGDIVGTADDGMGTVWAVKWTLAHLPGTGLRPLASR